MICDMSRRNGAEPVNGTTAPARGLKYFQASVEKARLKNRRTPAQVEKAGDYDQDIFEELARRSANVCGDHRRVQEPRGRVFRS